ncbi:MAG: hypothetical protein H7645_04695 [Candidatus Heimdallarchaeota archaeon]|nr:hypothetical protein [Candidatus Heimdallarchaeota archaeon]MCK4769616.1 hypothetical protein [Candidatus Heimdallarchaeota archaeon]
MTATLFVPYVSLMVLDETGMSLRCHVPIPDVPAEEIMGIGNFYSTVISASSPSLEIYGPLPIPHFGNYHLLIVSFRKFDSEVKDPRAMYNKKLAMCQLLIFYDKNCDQIVKYGHSQIYFTINEFLNQFEDVKEITDKNMIELSEELIENVLLDDQIKAKSIEDVVRDIASRFNTIQQVSHLLNRRTKIGIVTSDSLSYNLIIQALFHFQNIDFIYQLDRNEYITRIDTYFMRIVLTLLFDLEKIAGQDYFRDIDYYIYLASCEDEESTKRHLENIHSLMESDPKATIYFVTKEQAEELNLTIKKTLYNETEKRKNLKLMISIGDVFRTLDNSIYLILNDILELRNILRSKPAKS